MLEALRHWLEKRLAKLEAKERRLKRELIQEKMEDMSARLKQELVDEEECDCVECTKEERG